MFNENNLINVLIQWNFLFFVWKKYDFCHSKSHAEKLKIASSFLSESKIAQQIGNWKIISNSFLCSNIESRERKLIEDSQLQFVAWRVSKFIILAQQLTNESRYWRLIEGLECPVCTVSNWDSWDLLVQQHSHKINRDL